MYAGWGTCPRCGGMVGITEKGNAVCHEYTNPKRGPHYAPPWVGRKNRRMCPGSRRQVPVNRRLFADSLG